MQAMLHFQPCKLFFISFSLIFTLVISSSYSYSQPNDVQALLSFKSKADTKNKLYSFSPNTTFRFCQWQGVKCVQQRVIRLVLEDLDLVGTLAPDTLTRLDQLRILSLQNNSLTGPIPDLSGLFNLKTLFLDHNSFSGSFPPSILKLHRIRTVDLSYNNLTGALPSWLATLDRLYYLRLEWNRFNGTVPPLNQTTLQTFNVSGNNLTGPIPVTVTLVRFGSSSFSQNPTLCGEIINKECQPGTPFFTQQPSPSNAAPPPHISLGESAEVHGVELSHEPLRKKHERTKVIIGFSAGVAVLIVSVVCFVITVKRQRSQKESEYSASALTAAPAMDSEEADAAAAQAAMEQEKELEAKVKRAQGMQVAKSGSLVFCAGEAQLYSLDQLMRGSAELLGRGTIGTTYKAVLDNRLIVSVKRLDAGKLAGTSKEIFERHMESVGGLRHPNLVPLRAFFHAKEERLLVYDYQPNGSLSSLIHGKSVFIFLLLFKLPLPYFEIWTNVDKGFLTNLGR